MYPSSSDRPGGDGAHQLRTSSLERHVDEVVLLISAKFVGVLDAAAADDDADMSKHVSLLE